MQVSGLDKPDQISVGQAAAERAPEADPVVDATGHAGSAGKFSLGTLKSQVFARIETLDIAPDLGADIGSKRWFRGLGTFVGLSVVALAFWPDFAPLEAASQCQSLREPGSRLHA